MADKDRIQELADERTLELCEEGEDKLCFADLSLQKQHEIISRAYELDGHTSNQYKLRNKVAEIVADLCEKGEIYFHDLNIEKADEVWAYAEDCEVSRVADRWDDIREERLEAEREERGIDKGE